MSFDMRLRLVSSVPKFYAKHSFDVRSLGNPDNDKPCAVDSKTLELLQYLAGRWPVIWGLRRATYVSTLPQDGGRTDAVAVQQAVGDPKGLRLGRAGEARRRRS